MKKIIFMFGLLTSISSLTITPYYSIRSQSENAARELAGAGWNTQINRYNMDTWYGNLSITPEYTRSFRPYSIAQCLLGCCGNCCYPPCAFSPCCIPCCAPCIPLNAPCCEQGTPCCTPCSVTCCDEDFTVIRISGSQTINRNASDWLADYFGLPTDYKSCIVFEPRIANFLIDFNVYCGLDAMVEGLYFRIHAPVVYTRWTLNMCEILEDHGTHNHWPGYFNKTVSTTSTGTVVGIERDHLVSSFSAFIQGCDYIKSPDITFMSLCRAKMNCRPCTETALSDVQMALGWNFLCDEDYHVGINIRAAAPTGNRPEGYYLFEPIVGNGKHWELGGGFSSHVVLNRSIDEEKRWEFYFDANVTHLFKAKQCRTFDLCCKPLSRYMLAAKFSSEVNDLQAADDDGFGQPDNPQAPAKQFLGIYSPIANITTFAVDVSTDIQGDIVVMLQHIHGNWSFDLGYNFWGRSCEKIDLRCDCCPFTEGTWGLKGDAFMYGFTPYVDETSKAVPLSATESQATICQGTNNWPNGLNGIAWPQNPGIDNKKLAWDDSNNPLLIYDFSANTTHQIYTSLDPALISICDIDINGAKTKGISHKIFAAFDYTWRNLKEYVPYIGLGGEIEFGNFNDNSCCNPCNSCTSCCSYVPCNACGPCGSTDATDCCGPCCSPCYNTDSSCCNYCALSQLGIWLKGGFAF